MGNLFTQGNPAGRVGQNLATGDDTALFLKKFAGEVLTVFDEKNIMKPLHTIRTISKGKSAQFPVSGTANAGYYTPGDDILNDNLAEGTRTGKAAGGGLNQMKQTEVLINIDKVLMANTFIASIDELVSHFDVRSPYTHQLGEALAIAFDKNVLKTAIKTGAKQSVKSPSNRATGNDDALLPSDAYISGQTKRGSVVYSAKPAGTTASSPANSDDLYYNSVDQAHAEPASASGTKTGNLKATPNADYIRNALFESARLLDEKDVPQSDRFAIITPAMYYTLINSGDIVTGSVINRDIGGQGSIATGTVSQIAGITLLTSNHLPSDDHTTTENKFGASQASFNDYRLNYADVAGIVFQKGGFGTLKLMDLAMESEYQIQRQGTLFVAKYSMGHGALRPESVVVWSDGQRVGQ